MAKSARLDPELQDELERAAKALGVSQSELIRDAIARRCREVLGETLADRIAPVIGVVRGGGGRARNTGAAYVEALVLAEDVA
jgi:hypothetical protein